MDNEGRVIAKVHHLERVATSSEIDAMWTDFKTKKLKAIETLNMTDEIAAIRAHRKFMEAFERYDRTR